MKWVLSSKIQKAIVVGADPEYVGSVTIDEDLMDRAGLWAGERVMVVSTKGTRLETYVLTGKRSSGDILINGPAALLIKEGEEVMILGFTLTDRPIKAKNILVDRNNRFVRDVDEKEREKLEYYPTTV